MWSNYEKGRLNQRRRQDFGSGGGNILGGRPGRGSGGGAPGLQKIFQILQKIS